MMQNNYYQKRSCLRPYLLGWWPKTCLKTGAVSNPKCNIGQFKLLGPVGLKVKFTGR